MSSKYETKVVNPVQPQTFSPSFSRIFSALPLSATSFCIQFAFTALICNHRFNCKLIASSLACAWRSFSADTPLAWPQYAAPPKLIPQHPNPITDPLWLNPPASHQANREHLPFIFTFHARCWLHYFVINAANGLFAYWLQLQKAKRRSVI